MKKINFTLIIALIMTIFGISCKEKINIFSIQDDIKFGAQFDEEILKNKDFVILSETQYPEAYKIINQFKTTLLNTGKLTHVNDFNWTVRIIKNDATINAFAVPGGYLYFYTGLIKALENEAEFAGVMAHEMAHVDRRHTTSQLTKQYGIDLLLSMLLGKNSNEWVTIAANLASGLTELAFSRSDENEADKYAVNYTYVTDWDARGVADFFAKMDTKSPTPVFLSTHPKDETRIKRVNEEWSSLGGRQGEYFPDKYAQFIKSLQ